MSAVLACPVCSETVQRLGENDHEWGSDFVRPMPNASRNTSADESWLVLKKEASQNRTPAVGRSIWPRIGDVINSTLIIPLSALILKATTMYKFHRESWCH